MKDKLELKHLAPYPPTLKIMWEGIICTLEGIDYNYNETIILERVNVSLSDVKPILRPLFDLGDVNNKECSINELAIYSQKFYDSDIEQADFYELIVDIIHNKKTCEYLPYFAFQRILEWHFDVFKLIEKGLAIDIND